MNRRHRAIVDAVKGAIREGIRDVKIRDDDRIAEICGGFTDEEGARKRPDLTYESFVREKGKQLKYFNMTEITCPWSWEDSLEKAYMRKLEKYEPIRVLMQQRCPEYNDVRLNVIVVSPSGVFLQRSQKDFAVAMMLKGGRLAAHARFVVDAVIHSAHDHYKAYCNAMALRDQAKGVGAKYGVIEKEFKKQADDLEIVDSIREINVIQDGQPLAMEGGAISLNELRKMSEVEQSVRDETGIPFQKVEPHPDGFKKEGSDGRDHVFGKSTVRAKPKKKKPTGGVKYIKTVPLAKRDDDVE
jgi:hypothetical protein